MRTRCFGILLVLCSGLFLAGGCAKKEVVKPDTAATPPPVVDRGPATSEIPPETLPPQPVVTDSGIGEEGLTDSAIDLAKVFETIYFDLDSYVLRQDARDSLYKNAQWMKKKPTVNIRLEGHCDERGSDEYNLALGEKRAKAARDYLVILGISANRLETVSYGKEKPVDPGHNEAAWAKNRRVDFVLEY